MTKDSSLKRRIRDRMRLTAEPYSIARRAVLDGDDHITEQAIRRLFQEIEAYLGGKGRWLVPHGFDIESFEGRAFTLKMPVIWEPVRGAVIATASSAPSTVNLDELRELIERGLRFGDYLPGGELDDWSAQMPEGPRPSDMSWCVRARIRPR